MSDGCYVGVAATDQYSYVYVGCPDRAEFDKIKADAKDHGMDQHGNHVITKAVEQGPCTVVFQHWIAQESTDYFIARKQREREAMKVMTT